ncbi:family 20 glycosylhydrolase [Streptomyces sp. RS10V-4]|uniref:family 20 glycosylhydrolase n=1 Tax=Streptomyces rhizoryzae TaxID=2932493 RepID=UPI00200319B4|nr:family 20 glycosylhydrolase [Streptomyces rhizoryzae]MCK7627684.1 family 20 glycosylhydrolase [Streptomyces rhizoryzae]
MRHKRPTRRRAAALALTTALLAALTAALVPTTVQAATAPPATIPAVQKWSAGSGSYRFTGTSRVIARTASLRNTAELLAGDLRSVTGHAVAVATGTPAPGDIVLTRGSYGAESYRMAIGSTATISGTPTGVFYGTQTLLQMLKQHLELPQGTVNDAPTRPERGVMVDVARKYYSLGWLRNLVRELGYLKYNRLHLHLTDDQAFRLESSTLPEAVSAQHYTKQQIRDLVAYAAQYRVTIVPEIDMPGHMTQILNGHRSLSLLRNNGSRVLDLSQDTAAFKLTGDLINEYLPLFPGRYWQLGSDEWLTTAELSQWPALQTRARELFGPDATGRDLEYDFINKANKLVRGAGKTLRVWNDQLVPGTVVQVDPSVQVADWFGSTDMTPQDLAKQGHDLINANWNVLYYIIGGNPPNARTIYESFAPNQFPLGSGSTTVSDSDPHLLGTQLSLWGEPGQDEPEGSVANNLKAPLRSLIQNTWGSPKVAGSYSGFQAVIDTVGDAPTGGSAAPRPGGARASS